MIPKTSFFRPCNTITCSANSSWENFWPEMMTSSLRKWLCLSASLKITRITSKKRLENWVWVSLQFHYINTFNDGWIPVFLIYLGSKWWLKIFSLNWKIFSNSLKRKEFSFSHKFLTLLFSKFIYESGKSLSSNISYLIKIFSWQKSKHFERPSRYGFFWSAFFKYFRNTSSKNT